VCTCETGVGAEMGPKWLTNVQKRAHSQATLMVGVKALTAFGKEKKRSNLSDGVNGKSQSMRQSGVNNPDQHLP